MKKKKITNKEETKKGLKNREKGITLIALIVTIIVLLILAGVSIAMLTGDNGILNQAKKAKEETEKGASNEQAILNDYEDMINGNYVEIKQVTDKKPGVLEGSGTESDPYTINSVEDLVVFSYNVRNRNTYEGEFVNLGLSLDFSSDKSYVNPETEEYSQCGYNGKLKELLTSGSGFLPIGQYYVENGQEVSEAESNSFKGIFNGNNNAIKNLYINRVAERDNEQIGLFGSNFGEIKNLGLVNVNIQAEGVSTILGGIVGDNYNNIEGCYTTGNITCTSTLWSMVGGITGILEENSKVTKCYNKANVTHMNIGDKGQAVVGGIAGNTESGYVEITECYNSGNIYGSSEKSNVYVAGILGCFRQGNISNCYNTGKVEIGKAINLAYLGGIISASNTEENTVNNCYNIGDIFINSETNNSETNYGGIAGLVYNLTLRNVYNVGNITVNGKNNNIRIGGITGGYGNGNIYNGYNIGKIEAKDTSSNRIGSIIGYKVGTTENCYYLKNTWSKGIGELYEGQKDEGVTEYDDISKFPSVLDVINGDGVFKGDTNNINNGYPILAWQ